METPFNIKKYTIDELNTVPGIKEALVRCFESCISQIKNYYPINDSFVQKMESFGDTLNTLETESNTFYIATNTEGELLGALRLLDQGTYKIDEKNHRVLFSKFLGVSKKFQGKGFGTQIKQQIIEIMKEEKKENLYYFYSTVREKNSISQKMNGKVGMINRGETEPGSGTIQYGTVIH